MSKKIFSVIIPTYNRQNLLSRSIESVLGQVFTNFELIIVDNGSTDNSKAIALRYKEKDKRVKYFKQKNSGSPAGSRNTGIRKAKGKWIAFLDSDDYWYETKLQEVYNKIINLSDDYISVSHYEDKKAFDNKKVVTLYHGKYLSHSPFEELLFKGNSLSTSAMTVRKDKLFEVGLFDTRKNYYAVEDYDMWLKLAKVGKFTYIHKSLGVFALSESNMSGNIELINNNLKILVLNHINNLNIKNKNKLKKKHGSRIDYYKGRSYQINGKISLAIPILFQSIIDYPFSLKKFISLFFALLRVKR